MDIIRRLCAKHGIKLIDIRYSRDYYKKAGVPYEHFVDDSYVIGSGEIILGIYDDDEKRLASFLHELGHTKVRGDDVYENEAMAWRWAIKFAEKIGMKLSPKTIDWCMRKLKTYDKEEYRRAPKGG